MREGGFKKIIDLYKESIQNFPLLKYSWVLVATICILALTAYFKLRNIDVFSYVFAVLFICFVGFSLSLLIRQSVIYLKILLYAFITCLIFAMCSAILGFGYFIFFNKPQFFSQWFPDQNKPSQTIKPKSDIGKPIPATDGSIYVDKSTHVYNDNKYIYGKNHLRTIGNKEILALKDKLPDKDAKIIVRYLKSRAQDTSMWKKVFTQLSKMGYLNIILSSATNLPDNLDSGTLTVQKMTINSQIQYIVIINPQ